MKSLHSIEPVCSWSWIANSYNLLHVLSLLLCFKFKVMFWQLLFNTLDDIVIDQYQLQIPQSSIIQLTTLLLKHAFVSHPRDVLPLSSLKNNCLSSMLEISSMPVINLEDPTFWQFIMLTWRCGRTWVGGGGGIMTSTWGICDSFGL